MTVRLFIKYLPNCDFDLGVDMTPLVLIVWIKLINFNCYVLPPQPILG